VTNRCIDKDPLLLCNVVLLKKHISDEYRLNPSQPEVFGSLAKVKLKKNFPLKYEISSFEKCLNY